MRPIGFMTAALLIMASSAQAAWQVYIFRDQGFSIESPVPLVKGTGAYRGAVAGRHATIAYTGELENIQYKVSIVDFSNRAPEAVNLYLEMEFLTSLAGKVLANESVGIEPGKDRRYGRQLVVETKEGALVRTVLMYNQGKIYAVEATIPPSGNKDSFSPARFVESILFDLEGAARERDADPRNYTTPDGR